MICLLITADDFGKNAQTNRAIEIGFKDGILTSASLMVIGKKWREAVDIAHKRNMDVGLHLSLTEGKSICLGREINRSPAVLGLSAQFCQKTTAWIREEIAQQFQRFVSTGIPFHHVDSHHHIHVHPKVSGMVIERCRGYGIRSIRLPYEPWNISSSICNDHLFRNIFYKITFSSLCRMLAKKIHSSGLVSTDGVFGIYRTGEITEGWLLLLLDRLQKVDGIFELYIHPEDRKGSPGYEELKSITSQRVKDKIEDMGIRLLGFSDLSNIIHV